MSDAGQLAMKESLQLNELVLRGDLAVSNRYKRRVRVRYVENALLNLPPILLNVNRLVIRPDEDVSSFPR